MSATARPRWALPALAVLLGAAGALYLWGLGASGWSNEFYAAAVQAGTHNGTAWLFGSLDPANTITVDKPPAALWVMGLSARLFGFGPWSLLVPQALEGVAAVALLYAAVARWHGRAAGLAAGALLALTPIATVMFRMDDPDALMILLLVASAYAVVRACEGTSVRRMTPNRWMALAGAAAGLAFLTKMGQALVVLPGPAAAFLVAAAVPLRRRVAGLAAAGGAMVVAGGWYPLLVGLWPAGSRPYIGGSTDDSLLQLAIGYNGVGRIAGGDGNPASGGWGAGPWRLFGESMGAQISWLLPAALAGLAVLVVVSLRAPRTDATRAAAILWGGWLIAGGAVLSAMQGIVHSYYTAMLAPAIAALVAVGGSALWHRRDHPAARLTCAATVAATGTWAFVLLGRTPVWLPWLRWAVMLAASACALVLACAGLLPLVAPPAQGRWPRLAAAAAGLACAAMLAAPAAVTVAAAARPQGGASPTAAPGASAPPAGMHDGHRTGLDAPALLDAVRGTSTRWAAATVGATTAARLQLRTGRPVMPIGGYQGRDPAPTLAMFQADVAAGRIRYFLPRAGLDLFTDLLLGGREGVDAGPQSGTGPLAGLLFPAPRSAAPRADTVTARATLTRRSDARDRTAAARITSWVEAHYTPVRLGTMTAYDLTAPLP